MRIGMARVRCVEVCCLGQDVTVCRVGGKPRNIACTTRSTADRMYVEGLWLLLPGRTQRELFVYDEEG